MDKLKSIFGRHKDEGDEKITLRRALKEQKEAQKLNPRWLVPVIVAALVIGLVWIVVFYLTASSTTPGYPIPIIGNWNIAIGLVLILGGFILTTLWK